MRLIDADKLKKELLKANYNARVQKSVIKFCLDTIDRLVKEKENKG